MIRKLSSVLIALLIFSACHSQSFVRDDSNLDYGTLITNIALELVGTPYAEGTLETETERLVINFDKTDCILFVEMCVALAQTAKCESPDIESYSDAVRRLRYRNGIIDGYCSRLHYTSEWVQQGIDSGVFTDRTAALGGKRKSKKINYMSSHPDSYPSLRGNDDNISQIREIESRISGQSYWELAKESVCAADERIHDGDIILFMTSIDGLDTSHVGIAYHQDSILTFIHASSTANMVIVNPQPLTEYLQKQKTITGIRIIQVN